MRGLTSGRPERSGLDEFLAAASTASQDVNVGMCIEVCRGRVIDSSKLASIVVGDVSICLLLGGDATGLPLGSELAAAGV